ALAEVCEQKCMNGAVPCQCRRPAGSAVPPLLRLLPQPIFQRGLVHQQVRPLARPAPPLTHQPTAVPQHTHSPPPHPRLHPLTRTQHPSVLQPHTQPVLHTPVQGTRLHPCARTHTHTHTHTHIKHTHFKQQDFLDKTFKALKICLSSSTRSRPGRSLSWTQKPKEGTLWKSLKAETETRSSCSRGYRSDSGSGRRVLPGRSCGWGGGLQAVRSGSGRPAGGLWSLVGSSSWTVKGNISSELQTRRATRRYSRRPTGPNISIHCPCWPGAELQFKLSVQSSPGSPYT
ncbi:hypothetical protein AMEX_G25246, partial [Astyanax mexicanus]